VELLDDIHASADLPVVKPKHEMSEREYHPRQAFAMVRDELTLDGNSRQNLTPPMKPFPTHWDC
jgi:glutamate/tyrosine decarboxylase-like PLP-dependent enzyme